jgi:hypothetical protein
MASAAPEGLRPCRRRVVERAGAIEVAPGVLDAPAAADEVRPCQRSRSDEGDIGP